MQHVPHIRTYQLHLWEQDAATISKLFISSLTSTPKESWLMHSFISWTDIQSNCFGFLWFFFSYGFSFPDSTAGGKKRKYHVNVIWIIIATNSLPWINREAYLSKTDKMSVELTEGERFEKAEAIAKVCVSPELPREEHASNSFPGLEPCVLAADWPAKLAVRTCRRMNWEAERGR